MPTCFRYASQWSFGHHCLDGRNSAPHSAPFPQAFAAGWNCALHTGARARCHLITRKIIQNHPHCQVSALLGFDVKPVVEAGGDCSRLRVDLFPLILKAQGDHSFGDTNADNSTSAATHGGNDGRCRSLMSQGPYLGQIVFCFSSFFEAHHQWPPTHSLSA